MGMIMECGVFTMLKRISRLRTVVNVFRCQTFRLQLWKIFSEVFCSICRPECKKGVHENSDIQGRNSTVRR